MNNDKINNFLIELLDTCLSSIFDPNPVCFKPEHESGIKLLRNLLSRPTFEIQKLSKKLVRNAFLCGCLDYTEHEPIEHLIVGYGVKRGIGTDIHAIQHVVGCESNVSIPETVSENIRDYLSLGHRSEIIIFHNHPINWINALIDNLPLASSTDRRTILTKKYLENFQFIRQLLFVGGIRFYLGENGFVREIRAPSILNLLEMFGKYIQSGGHQ